MELKKELKEKLENAESKEEVKKIIEDAGIELTDEMLEEVAGGRMYQGILLAEDTPPIPPEAMAILRKSCSRSCSRRRH